MHGHRNHTLLGALFMVLAMITFSVMNVVVKDTASQYPILQLVFFRNCFALIPAIYLIKRQGNHAFSTKSPGRNILAGAIGVFGLFCLFKSFEMLPLADATAFSYSSILFVTLLSVPFLKEKVGFARWIAVLIGFMGVVVMLNPTGSNILQTGALFSFGFAIVDATVLVNSRILTKTDHPGTVVFYYALVSTLLSGIGLFFGHWVTPTLPDLMKLIFLGVGGGVGQILITQACRYAPASVVSPLNYTSLIWSALLGFFIWSDIPSVRLLVGAAIVIACGIFITLQAHKDSKKSNPLVVGQVGEVV